MTTSPTPEQLLAHGWLIRRPTASTPSPGGRVECCACDFTPTEVTRMRTINSNMSWISPGDLLAALADVEHDCELQREKVTRLLASMQVT